MAPQVCDAWLYVVQAQAKLDAARAEYRPRLTFDATPFRGRAKSQFGTDGTLEFLPAQWDAKARLRLDWGVPGGAQLATWAATGWPHAYPEGLPPVEFGARLTLPLLSGTPAAEQRLITAERDLKRRELTMAVKQDEAEIAAMDAYLKAWQSVRSIPVQPSQYARWQASITRLLRSLGELTGLPVTVDSLLAAELPSLDGVDLSLPDLEQARVQATRNRYVRLRELGSALDPGDAAEAETSMNDANIEEELTGAHGWMPRVTFIASTGMDDVFLPKPDWRIEAGVQINLYDGGKRAADIRKATVAVTRSLVSLQREMVSQAAKAETAWYVANEAIAHWEVQREANADVPESLLSGWQAKQALLSLKRLLD